jgi:hypothetical protein
VLLLVLLMLLLTPGALPDGSLSRSGLVIHTSCVNQSLSETLSSAMVGALI